MTTATLDEFEKLLEESFSKSHAVADIVEGTANGTIKVDGDDVAVHGLGTAAYTAATNYATAAQGAKADTALQQGNNISLLTNDANYITSSDLSGLATETGVAATVNAATATASNVSLNVSGSVTGDVTGNVPAFVNWGDNTATGTIALANGAVSNGTIAAGATATGSISNIDVSVTGYQSN